MAEVNAMQTLISAALQQAYRYQTSEYIEIFRRFMQPNSRDPDVRDFAPLPESGRAREVHDARAWDIEPERIMGGGNKTLEMAQAQQLMSGGRPLAPTPASASSARRRWPFIDDPAEADVLVPTEARCRNTR